MSSSYWQQGHATGPLLKLLVFAPSPPRPSETFISGPTCAPCLRTTCLLRWMSGPGVGRPLRLAYGPGWRILGRKRCWIGRAQRLAQLDSPRRWRSPSAAAERPDVVLRPKFRLPRRAGSMELCPPPGCAAEIVHFRGADASLKAAYAAAAEAALPCVCFCSSAAP